MTKWFSFCVFDSAFDFVLCHFFSTLKIPKLIWAFSASVKLKTLSVDSLAATERKREQNRMHFCGWTQFCIAFSGVWLCRTSGNSMRLPRNILTHFTMNFLWMNCHRRTHPYTNTHTRAGNEDIILRNTIINRLPKQMLFAHAKITENIP